MAQKESSGREPKPLPSPDCHQEENEQPKQPKLSMKFLHGLIRELQRENRLLAKQVEELQLRLQDFERIQAEVAAAEEPQISIADTGVTPCPVPKTTQPDTAQEILVPRSVRHPVPKKRPFWALLFPSKRKQHA